MTAREIVDTAINGVILGGFVALGVFAVLYTLV
jgi:hypothetical protein